ncbi:MAG TPA: hypothetical protein VMA53_04875 [Stellaceae bacterium]|nr:hypothetical protein [Stellaceae bacterium]
MPRSSPEPRLRRLDRVVAEINVVLLVIALGLGVLDLVLLAALHMPPTPPISETSAAGNGAPNGDTGSKASLGAFGF